MKYTLTINQAGHLFLYACAYQPGDNMPPFFTDPAGVQGVTNASDYVLQLRKELRKNARVEENGSMLFGQEGVKLDSLIEINIHDDAWWGAYYVLLSKLHLKTAREQRASIGLADETLWPIARILKCEKKLRKELNIDQVPKIKPEYDCEEVQENGQTQMETNHKEEETAQIRR